jgi:hypothetical protein
VVEQWLKSYLPNLKREDACNYSKCLVEDGFDSIDILDVLEEKHLGFMKIGHRLLLMKKLDNVENQSDACEAQAARKTQEVHFDLGPSTAVLPEPRKIARDFDMDRFLQRSKRLCK